MYTNYAPKKCNFETVFTSVFSSFTVYISIPTHTSMSIYLLLVQQILIFATLILTSDKLN